MINEKLLAKQHLPALWSMKNEQFYFVQKMASTFRLKKKEGTHAIGEAGRRGLVI